MIDPSPSGAKASDAYGLLVLRWERDQGRKPGPVQRLMLRIGAREIDPAWLTPGAPAPSFKRYQRRMRCAVTDSSAAPTRESRLQVAPPMAWPDELHAQMRALDLELTVAFGTRILGERGSWPMIQDYMDEQAAALSRRHSRGDGDA